LGGWAIFGAASQPIAASRCSYAPTGICVHRLNVGADEQREAAIGCAAVVKLLDCGIPDTTEAFGFRAVSRPIVDKSTPTAFGQKQTSASAQSASAAGVGVQLADDLARSGSKT
jgi:hypothetical protein